MKFEFGTLLAKFKTVELLSSNLKQMDQSLLMEAKPIHLLNPSYFNHCGVFVEGIFCFVLFYICVVFFIIILYTLYPQI